MPLMWKDTTGTATDCEKPLSRKKLKALMPSSRMGLTSRELYAKTGRLNANIRKELAEAERKRLEAAALAVSETKTTAKFVASDPSEAEAPKNSSLFNRLGSMFDKLRRSAERESRKGK